MPLRRRHIDKTGEKRHRPAVKEASTVCKGGIDRLHRPSVRLDSRRFLRESLGESLASPKEAHIDKKKDIDRL